MKKVGLIVIVLSMVFLFLMGCSPRVKSSGFYEHDTHYKNWDHMKFSLFGYQKPTLEVAKKSTQQGWWGEPINFEGYGD